jgi:prepilin-type processing-associated H-X9-DG protein
MGYWQTPRVWDADPVSVLADMFWVNAWPHHTGVPAAIEQQFPAPDGTGEMQLVCVNRHDGAINLLFADWSVRKAGLKDLWTFKWSRLYNTSGPWTAAGGVTPADWPQWMRQFKDF